jgi:hypothetical protein
MPHQIGKLFFTLLLDGESDPKTISVLNEEGIRTIVSNEFLRGNERETTLLLLRQPLTRF